MRKNEKGVLTVEASISLLSVVFFVLFLFNFVRIYRAQSVVSHATIQAADAIGIESYLREKCYRGDAKDIAYIVNHMTGTSNITESTFESLRETNVVSVAKDKFVSALGKNKVAANDVLESCGIKNGIDGVDFSASTVDLKNYDIILRASYTVKLQFGFFGLNEVNVTKCAKAKNFGEIMFDVSVKSSDNNAGTVSGSGSYKENEKIIISAEPLPGFRFVRWNDGSTDPRREITVVGKMTFIAEFERIGYGVRVKTIVVNAPDKSNGTDVSNMKDYNGFAFVNYSGEGVYSYEAAATLSFSEAPNYKIKYIKDADTGKVYTQSVINIPNISRDYNIVVAVEPISYTVKVAASPNSRGTAVIFRNFGKETNGGVTEMTVKYGSRVTLCAMPLTGNRFTGWSGGGDAIHTITVTGNVSKTASFEIIRCQVNIVSAGGGGVWEKNTGKKTLTVDYGTTVSIVASPDSYYKFNKWTVGNKYGTLVSSSPNATVTIKNDMTIVGVFDAEYDVNRLGLQIRYGDTGVQSSRLTAVTYPEGVAVNWSSSNPDILSVDNAGNITAREEGTVRVTASFTMYGITVTDTCEVDTTKYYNLQYCYYSSYTNGGYVTINGKRISEYYKVHTQSNICSYSNHRCYKKEDYASKKRVSEAEINKCKKVGPKEYMGFPNSYMGWNRTDETGYVFYNGSADAMYFLGSIDLPEITKYSD